MRFRCFLICKFQNLQFARNSKKKDSNFNVKRSLNKLGKKNLIAKAIYNKKQMGISKKKKIRNRIWFFKLMGKNKKLRFLGQKGGPKPRRPSVCLSVLSVCVCVIPLFELGATGTRQIWWVCAEFNSKKSDRAIFELAHLFAEL